MTELEKLKQQKKEIESKIRQLSNKCFRNGKAKLEKRTFPTSRPSEWVIAVEVEHDDGRTRWQPIAISTDKQKTIQTALELIHDLEELYSEHKQEVSE